MKTAIALVVAGLAAVCRSQVLHKQTPYAGAKAGQASFHDGIRV